MLIKNAGFPVQLLYQHLLLPQAWIHWACYQMKFVAPHENSDTISKIGKITLSSLFNDLAAMTNYYFFIQQGLF